MAWVMVAVGSPPSSISTDVNQLRPIMEHPPLAVAANLRVGQIRFGLEPGEFIGQGRQINMQRATEYIAPNVFLDSLIKTSKQGTLWNQLRTKQAWEQRLVKETEHRRRRGRGLRNEWMEGFCRTQWGKAEGAWDLDDSATPGNDCWTVEDEANGTSRGAEIVGKWV